MSVPLVTVYNSNKAVGNNARTLFGVDFIHVNVGVSLLRDFRGDTDIPLPSLVETVGGVQPPGMGCAGFQGLWKSDRERVRVVAGLIRRILPEGIACQLQPCDVCASSV